MYVTFVLSALFYSHLKTQLTDGLVALGRVHPIVLSDEELGAINHSLHADNRNPLCTPFQVITYPKVAVNKTIVCTSRTTTRNNRTISYTTNSGVQYGVVQKLVTVYLESSDPLHFTLINPLMIGTCSALQQLAFPIELADYHNIITTDFLSVVSRSSHLTAIITDNITMKMFDINLALTHLVNESEIVM